VAGGALAVLLSGDITPRAALAAVDPDVMLFLFGMFVVGHAIEEGGFLQHLAYRMFRRARTADALVLFILFGMGGLSAFLMNDTLAVVGTPVVLLLARRHGIRPQIFLLALAIAVTTGSVPSPIGNPQNLLIAIHTGLANPFLDFLRSLFAPTVVNLFLAYGALRLFYHPYFTRAKLTHDPPPAIADPRLAALSRLGLGILVLLVVVKIVWSLSGRPGGLPLTAIALGAAAPILVLSGKRALIMKKVDWHTLVFFAAMFVLMASVWETGFFQAVMGRTGWNPASAGSVLGASIALSQLISNVPLVAMMLPMLEGAGARGALALAAGSTIAGNLLILGAASNVIIIQNAEKRGGEAPTFWEFARVGAPLTLCQAAVYGFFLGR
jgi:Na+/H+ antiporter NhaD/arsenite permease-like protein